jgi:RimJ/RimL family protein N-acetyltransferase
LQEASATVRQVHLTVIADNLRARALYERHGFRTYGIEPASVRRDGSFVDEVLMARVFEMAEPPVST